VIPAVGMKWHGAGHLECLEASRQLMLYLRSLFVRLLWRT